MLYYTFSDARGRFSLRIESPLDSLQLNVSHLGYAQQQVVIPNRSQVLHLVLQKSSKHLKTLLVKLPRIRMKGDTLSYAVAAFKSRKDRVIADVLQKLPGIEVEENGKILYQGKPIQKYYINGLDLLEGKYKLADDHLPVAAVSSVQVMENHQPIKLLDGLVYTDRASLNIKLKKRVTTTGTVRLGAGLSPLLWTARLTPMRFGKKHQLIASYQADNTGEDLSKETQTLTVENLLEQLENKSQQEDWLHIRQPVKPPFSSRYWLDNNAQLLSANYLLQLKKGRTLKLNASYRNDYQKESGYVETTLFTADSSLLVREHTADRLSYSVLQNAIVLEENTPKHYLKDKLQFKRCWNTQRGDIDALGSDVTQKLKNPTLSWGNRLYMIVPVGKLLTALTSKLTYTQMPQELSVAPGGFESLLNGGKPIVQSLQKVRFSNFDTDNKLSFSRGFGKLRVAPTIGLSLRRQALESSLRIDDGQGLHGLASGFQNALTDRRAAVYVDLDSRYRQKSWRLEWHVPLTLRTYAAYERGVKVTRPFNRLTLEPRLAISELINPFWRASLGLRLKHDFGAIDQLYSGFILSDYRSLRRYDTLIPERLHMHGDVGLSYRNPLQSLFASLSYAFEQTRNNLLYSTAYSTDGSARVEAIQRENRTFNHTLHGRVGSYLNAIQTNWAFQASLSYDRAQQFIDGHMADVRTQSQHFSTKINTDLTHWLSVAYRGRFSDSHSCYDQRGLKPIQSWAHRLDLNLYPAKGQLLTIENEYDRSTAQEMRNSAYFLAAMYRYRFSRQKVDLELSWNNILHAKRYVTVSRTALAVMRSAYVLRPSQLLLSLRCSF